jgi:hypothetical protein
MMGTALGRIERPNRSRRQPRRAAPVVSLPTGENEDGHECPVCMVAMGSTTFAFPCGHCVCTNCDSKLQERGFYACPTCRQPREGVTRAQVDAAASARVQRDQLSDQLHMSPAGRASFVEHNGSTYQIVFLRDESDTARPFDVLRTVGVDDVAGQTTERGAGGHRRVGVGQEPVVIDLTNDDSGVDASVADNGRGLVLSGPLAQMVEELLQPTHLLDFLHRHNSLTSLMTAVNARPR